MTNEEKINGLFHKFLTGTDQDKAEVREFIRRHENMHLLYNPAFVQAAVANAEAFGIKQLTLEEFEADLDAETECPHCGHPLKW